MYRWPEDEADNRRWLSVISRVTDKHESNLHSRHLHSAFSIPSEVVSDIQQALLSKPTLKICDLLCRKGHGLHARSLLPSSHTPREGKEYNGLPPYRGVTTQQTQVPPSGIMLNTETMLGLNDTSLMLCYVTLNSIQCSLMKTALAHDKTMKQETQGMQEPCSYFITGEFYSVCISV